MTILYLIRHGQTDWNIEGRWQGQADVPLNPNGKRQAIKIAKQMSFFGVDAIYSSDLIRAAETAKEISKVINVDYKEDCRLREIHQGEWQGLLVREIEDKYTDIFKQRLNDPLHIAPPGGEPVIKVRDRVIEFVEEIVSTHPDERVAIVSHGFALAVIQVHKMNRSIRDVWHYVPDNEEWRVLRI